MGQVERRQLVELLDVTLEEHQIQRAHKRCQGIHWEFRLEHFKPLDCDLFRHGYAVAKEPVGHVMRLLVPLQDVSVLWIAHILDQWPRVRIQALPSHVESVLMPKRPLWQGQQLIHVPGP